MGVKGPMLYAFSDLFFIPGSHPHRINYPKNTTDLEKTIFLALRLQPLAKKAWFHMF